jgi:hypothetical protein
LFVEGELGGAFFDFEGGNTARGRFLIFFTAGAATAADAVFRPPAASFLDEMMGSMIDYDVDDDD